jgi:hypothetical protein
MSRDLLAAALLLAAAPIRSQTIRPEPMEAPEAAEVAGPSAVLVGADVDFLMSDRFTTTATSGEDLYHRLSSLHDVYRDDKTTVVRKAACALILEAVSRPPERWGEALPSAMSPVARRRLATMAARLDAHKRRYGSGSSIAKLLGRIDAELADGKSPAPSARAFEPLSEEQVQAEFVRWSAAAFKSKSSLVLAGPDFRGEAEPLSQFSYALRPVLIDETLGGLPSVRAAFNDFVGRARTKSRFHYDADDWLAYARDSTEVSEATWLYPHRFAPYDTIAIALKAHPDWAQGAPGLGDYLLGGLDDLATMLSSRPREGPDSERTAARARDVELLFGDVLDAVDALATAKSPFLHPTLAEHLGERIRRVAPMVADDNIQRKARLLLMALKLPAWEEKQAILAPTAPAPLPTAADYIFIDKWGFLAGGLAGALLCSFVFWDLWALWAYLVAAGSWLTASAIRYWNLRRKAPQALPERQSDPEYEKAFAQLDAAYSANLEPEQLKARIAALPVEDQKFRIEGDAPAQEEPQPSSGRSQGGASG